MCILLRSKSSIFHVLFWQLVYWNALEDQLPTQRILNSSRSPWAKMWRCFLYMHRNGKIVWHKFMMSSESNIERKCMPGRQHTRLWENQIQNTRARTRRELCVCGMEKTDCFPMQCQAPSPLPLASAISMLSLFASAATDNVCGLFTQRLISEAKFSPVFIASRLEVSIATLARPPANNKVCLKLKYRGRLNASNYKPDRAH